MTCLGRPARSSVCATWIAATILMTAATVMTPRPAAARERDREAEDEAAAAKRARGHFQKGEKLFALGKFDDALAEYEAAFDAQPLPEFLFNIGQCHRNLKDYEAAIFSFKKYLRLRPDAANRRAVEKLVTQLEAQLEDVEADPGNPPPKDEQRVPLVPPADERPRNEDSSRPFYSSWRFWTGVTLVVASAGAFYYFWPRDSSIPDSDLGNIDFPR